MMMVTEANRVGPVEDETARVAAARSGDTNSFEALMRRYERKIYRLARTIAKNEGDAEEIIQEAFLKAFEHIEDFKGESSFYTWLVRITVNEALMKLRKRRAGQVSLDEPIDTEEGSVHREIQDWELTPEERYSQNELAQILFRAISQLQPRLRIVFQSRDIESLSIEETATLLGISVSAFKSRLLRARLWLRNTLSRFVRKGAECPTALLYVFAARGMRHLGSEWINLR